MATRLTREPVEVNEAKAQIVELAKSLGTGQFAAQLCPECDGGATHERSLSLDVGANGIIKFYCHRASCEFSGNAYLTPSLIGTAPRMESKRGQNPLTSEVHPLDARDQAFFLSRYNLSAQAIENRVYRTESRYALPILRPNGTRRGFLTRRPWDGSPADTQANRNDPQWSNKALTYLEADEPCMSWYGDIKQQQLIYLVEDQLSAMRIVDYWQRREGNSLMVAAVALLGVGLNAGKVAEIQQVTGHGGNVMIALDADATGLAFALARKWGPAFEYFRVCVLSKDLKDCTDEELDALPL